MGKGTDTYISILATVRVALQIAILAVLIVVVTRLNKIFELLDDGTIRTDVRSGFGPLPVTVIGTPVVNAASHVVAVSVMNTPTVTFRPN